MRNLFARSTAEQKPPAPVIKGAITALLCLPAELATALDITALDPRVTAQPTTDGMGATFQLTEELTLTIYPFSRVLELRLKGHLDEHTIAYGDGFSKTLIRGAVGWLVTEQRQDGPTVVDMAERLNEVAAAA